MRKTIVARIATFDTSVKPTPEQVAETRRLLALVMEALGKQHPDFPMIQKIDELLSANKDIKGPVAQSSAQTEGTPQDDMLGGDVASWGHALDKIPAAEGTPKPMLRLDGSAKGAGFLGRVPYRSGDPRDYMTEQSIGSAKDLKPLLVPTLTPDEVAAVATPGSRVPESAYRKAEDHAAARLSAGKPAFAQSGELKPLHPGLVDMMAAQPRKKSWSAAAMDYLMKAEGFKTRAYPDPAGQTEKWSVGYGNQFHPGQKVPVRRGDTVAPAKAREYMADAVMYNVDRLRGSIGKSNWDGMTGGQKLALTSWAYNVGETAVRGSTLARRIKAGEKPADVLAQELPKWNDKGKAAKRRAEELKFAASGDYE